MDLIGIGSIVETVGKLAGQFVTTDKERAEMALREKELDQRLDLAQIEVNKAEAASGNLFTSGWRPGIGWTGAIALFLYYVPYVVIATGLWTWQVIQTGTLLPRPDLGITDLLGLISAMLGLAGMRTYEKRNGVAK